MTEANMIFATIRSAALALVLASASGLALAQGSPPPQWQHNSTTGAASTDIANPPVVVHIPSGQDAAKFNREADADDQKPTMAHALALTDEQRRFISSSISGKGQPSGQPDFKPEVAALMPQSAKPQDLPGDIAAKMPWVAPYKYALIEDKILLVDPVNSYIVLEILNR
jgi:hypothetical protein